MIKIGIWGQLGGGGQIADGQAVRTTIITKEIKERYGEKNVKVLDTFYWKNNPIAFFLKTIGLFFQCQKIVIFPADNGFKVVTLIYAILLHFKKKHLFDVVIGGYLPGLIDKHKKYALRLKKYKALFVQTPSLKKELNLRGLHNVYILSNLKRLNTRSIEDVIPIESEIINVCTLSRITADKGIDDAVEAVNLTNERLGGQFVYLDVFGIVSDDYRNHFEGLLKQYSSFLKYRGVLQYNKTSDTLKNYFAMLFPTYYYGEGFPGNVIDALNAGIPIIATDWKYNKEVVVPERNGLLVPVHDSSSLSDALLDLYMNRLKVQEIGKNNIIDSAKYAPESVLADFYFFLDQD